MRSDLIPDRVGSPSLFAKEQKAKRKKKKEMERDNTISKDDVVAPLRQHKELRDHVLRSADKSPRRRNSDEPN